MKQPKIKTIDWVQDLLAPPKQSELRALAEQEKQGKITVWKILCRSDIHFVTVIYDET